MKAKGLAAAAAAALFFVVDAQAPALTGEIVEIFDQFLSIYDNAQEEPAADAYAYDYYYYYYPDDGASQMPLPTPRPTLRPTPRPTNGAEAQPTSPLPLASKASASPQLPPASMASAPTASLSVAPPLAPVAPPHTLYSQKWGLTPDMDWSAWDYERYGDPLNPTFGLVPLKIDDLSGRSKGPPPPTPRPASPDTAADVCLTYGVCSTCTRGYGCVWSGTSCYLATEPCNVLGCANSLEECSTT